MSTTDTSYTTAPQPAYGPASPPAPKRRTPWLAIVAGVLGLALVVVTVLAFGQHGKAVDAREHAAQVTEQRDDASAQLASTEKTLSSTEDDLAATQDDLDAAQSTVADKDVQLAACALVVRISDLQWEESEALGDEAEALLDDDYSTALSKIGQARRLVNRYASILKDNGYKYINDLWTTCSPAYDSI